MYLGMFIPGDPVPQPRPRITVRGKHGVAYVPRDHPIHAWRKKIADRMQREMGTSCPVSGVGLRVMMEFSLQQPKSNKNPLPVVKPDLDNLAKAVLDAGNGVIWRDDSQVTTLATSKRWHDKPGVWLEISEDTEEQRAEHERNVVMTAFKIQALRRAGRSWLDSGGRCQ